MVIQLNTETCKVVEKAQACDKEITQEEMRTRIANLLITALCGNAIKNCRSREDQKRYIMAVSMKAIEALDGVKRGDNANEK